MSNKLRIPLTILCFTLALGLISHKPIRNWMISLKSQQYTIDKIAKSDITRTAQGDTTFDFENVAEVDTVNVMTDYYNDDHLPVTGAIAIPDVAINLPIFIGLSNQALSYGAGTMKETQVMGGENNYALAGHHVFDMVNSASVLFSPLEKAKPGMSIYLTDKEKIYTYTITTVKTVAPTEVSVIEDEGSKRLLTLVTCSDRDATNRIIVQAELIDERDYTYKGSPFSTSFNQANW